MQATVDLNHIIEWKNSRKTEWNPQDIDELGRKFKLEVSLLSAKPIRNFLVDIFSCNTGFLLIVRSNLHKPKHKIIIVKLKIYNFNFYASVG